MGKYKRETEVIKIHDRRRENVNWGLETAESKRSIAEDFWGPESVMRKKLKPRRVMTSLGSFEAKFSNEGKVIYWLLQGFRRHILRCKEISLCLR